MGRSQRHKIVERSAASNGEVHAQGVIAPGIMAQVSATEIGVLEPMEGDAIDLVVPVGPTGGPLQGSSMTGAIPVAFVPPVPLPPPALTSIDPTTAEMGSADLTLTATGTDFVQGSVIMFNNSANETTFVSETELTTLVVPSTASGPWTVPVGVRNPDYQESSTVDFSFTEPAPPLFERPVPQEPEVAARAVGPINIVSIRPAEGGGKLIVTVGDPTGILPGTIITIEASGSSSVNGQYTVEATENGELIIDSDYQLANPIEGKGRVLLGS